MSERRELPRDLAGLVSLLLLAVGTLTVCGVGLLRYFRNGTLWMDEAGVALSLLELPSGELLGRLVGGYSFPRPYLLTVRGLQALLGFEPWVLRLLPVLAFVSATAVWIGLLWRRFGGAPWLLALGIALVAIPTSWPVYGAMFKQYSLDVLVALLPFCLSDRFYRETLREGRRPFRLALLAVFCATSFTYVFALLGRWAGWYAAGLGERRLALHPLGVAWAVAGVAVFTGSLYFTDLRHTAGESSLYSFWQSCLINESPAKAARSIEYFLFGWYFGRLEFVPVAGLPWTVHWILRAAFFVGAVRLTLQLYGGRAEAWLGREPVATGWGSRSLGCAATLCGFLIAAAIASYPICPGRLTLFALFSLQVVTLEGLDVGSRALQRLQAGRVVAAVLGSILVAAVLPTAARSVVAVATAQPPENLRPLLRHVAERPELPVLATPCSTKQVQTVAEWIAESPVVPWNDWTGLRGREVFILNAKRSGFCQRFVTQVRRETASWEALHGEDDTAELYLARIAPEGARPAPWQPPDDGAAGAANPRRKRAAAGDRRKPGHKARRRAP